MPTPPAVSPTTLRQAVSSCFVSRPTLRQVLDSELYKLLLRHVPSVLTYAPHLLSAGEIYVQMPVDNNNFRAVKPLLDVFMQALVEGQPVTFSAEHLFTTLRDGKLLQDLVVEEGIASSR